MPSAKPDPSKSSSTSPPAVALLNSTEYSVTGSQPPILMDHVQIKMCLTTNLTDMKAKAAVNSDLDAYFHNTNAWLNEELAPKAVRL